MAHTDERHQELNFEVLDHLLYGLRIAPSILLGPLVEALIKGY